ncbi:MAG: hypothetical protein ACRD5R_06220 [Candidatus Acidiferrales bacterium]
MPSFHRIARFHFVLAACGLLLAMSGCVRHKSRATTPVASPPSAPIETKPPNSAPAPPPKVGGQPASAPPLPAGTNPAPDVPRPKPKKNSQESAQDSQADQPAHPPAPQISPQISPSDQATYERKINDDLSVTGKNLEQAKDKPLSAGQQDLAEKIRSFVAQSLDASKTGDWARAQNLAQKARLLSDELVGSL